MKTKTNKISNPGRDKARPSRKTPVHQCVYRSDSRVPVVFLTVCSKDKKKIFNNQDVHELLKTVWINAALWITGRYIIMPDHIHLFCSPDRNDSIPLSRWVQYWKSQASLRWPQKEEQPVWQKSFWDTQIRHGESYQSKWEYVRQNPVRAGLCGSANDWPYQGELNTLNWHD